jgi:hypothetical protein
MRHKHANSFCEWVVGANYTRRKKATTSTQRTVASLSWLTDDETDTDTIALSIPRRSGKHACEKNEKQVRFAPTADELSEETKKVSDVDRTSNFC